MTEYLKLNEHPLKQQAKKALKLEADDGLLYSLQLMLRRADYKLLPQNRVEQIDMVEDLLADTPENAMKYLLESDLPGEEFLLPEPGQEPLTLAQLLLLQLHNKMAPTLTNYPTTQLSQLPAMGR